METLVGTASAVASTGKRNRTRYFEVTQAKAPATNCGCMPYLMAKQQAGELGSGQFWSERAAWFQRPGEIDETKKCQN